MRVRNPNPFSADVRSDWESFVSCVKREITPTRVHFIELFLDEEIKQTIARRYGILDSLGAADRHFAEKREKLLNAISEPPKWP